ncbi:hypothetical protein ES705_08268 [subsurface metagenome]|nr:DUF47 family protein [Methanosarcinales archaeon]
MEEGASSKTLVLNAVLHKMQGFLPREKKFFVLFEDLAGKAVEAAELLVELGVKYSRLPQISEQLKELEEEADSVVHQIIRELFYDHTRVTEEKADIRYFAHNLDNVIDGIEKAVVRLTFTQKQTLPEPVSEFSPIILEASREIRTAVGCLRDMGCEEESLEACCIVINELENEADKINRKWLRMLMTTPVENPNELLDRLLLKEIVEILENTMDECEDVANILETFRLKGGI